MIISQAEMAVLVVRAKRGEGDAFALLVRVFLRAAYATALAIVDRPSDAEDVAQDAFAVAFERIDSCREPERFAGWLLQIVRNRALNWLDRRRLCDVASGENPPVAVIEAIKPELIGLKEQLLEALSNISSMQRHVVLLHDLDEWTHAEVGAALGISEGMSRQHLFQARRGLRSWLEKNALARVKP